MEVIEKGRNTSPRARRSRPGRKRKVLYISHNHPNVRPGGAEAYALELYEAMRASDEFEPIFVARTGPPMSPEGQPHPGTPFAAVGDDAGQYFVYTDAANFDPVFLTLRDKELYAIHFRELLLAHRPDVVHFQHTYMIGFDLLREVRNTLPDAAILYTLHEFMPICHRHGLMLRTQGDELCKEASPRRCNQCYPSISPQSFFMRERYIKSALSLVDLFLAPSHFLLERYVDWGIPREKIRFEDYGRRAVPPIQDISQDDRPRDRFGFFGQLNRFKGIDVLLEAMKIVEEGRRTVSTQSAHGTMRRTNRGQLPHLLVHGANLDLAESSFQSTIASLLEATADSVTMVGRYDHADLPNLMEAVDWVIVPSIWYENSPLVIQEAFAYGRPVICSDIGAMAEKVADGVNGLHFRRSDPLSLAQTIRRAAGTPGLWEDLRAGIPAAYRISDQVEHMSAMYRSLLKMRKSKGEYRAN